jgi:hypothetical protein
MVSLEESAEYLNQQSLSRVPKIHRIFENKHLIDFLDGHTPVGRLKMGSLKRGGDYTGARMAIDEPNN